MRQQKTRTTSYNCKLHGSMTLEIHIFAQLSNLFSEELKTKQKIKYTHEEKNELQSQKVKKMCIMLQGKNYILLTLPTLS